MILEKGKTYAADLKLGLFESMVGNDTIVAKFTSLGFTSVEVSGSGSWRKAKGTWTGETSQVKLPSQVYSVWVE
jgi:hypothetical protein